jgi:hypothetical protein
VVQLVQLVPLAARLRLPPSDPMQTWHADSRGREIAKRNCGTKPKHNNTTPKHTTETTTQGQNKNQKANTHTHTQQNKDTETQKHRDTKTQRHRNTQGCNSSRFCAWWGGGQSKVSFVIQNGTLHNIFSGAAIQADSVHGGVVDNQK